MTHGSGDGGQNTDVDEHMIAELPFGIHFDSLEGKWIGVGAIIGFMMMVTGSMELLALVGPVALGVRNSQLPKLSNLEPQPWWWAGGVFLGITLGTVVKLIMEHFGYTTPDVNWIAVLETATSLV